MESEQDKQPLHSHPRSRLKPGMEIQRAEWAEGKNKTKENTSNKRPETDRQLDRQRWLAESFITVQFIAASHSSVIN